MRIISCTRMPAAALLSFSVLFAAQGSAATLLAAYDFNDGAGATVTDRSGNGHGGTLINGPQWGAGKYAGGLSFDGSDDYVDVGDVDQADGRTAVTVSAWVRFATAGSGGVETHLVDKSLCNGYTNSGPWELGVSLTVPHKAEFMVYPNNGSPTSYIFSGASTTSVDDGNWHFIVGRYDGNALSIWVDGVQENSRSVGAFALSSTRNRVDFGGRCNGYVYPFKGSLDDVRIYDGGLTQSQIQADMTTPVGNVASTDTSAPSVTITNPTSGATLTGQATLNASASDNVGVAYVQFQVDGAAIGGPDSTSPYSTTWNTTTVGNGSHTLTAIAEDSAGNRKTSTGVVVTVSNNASPPADTTPPSSPTGLNAQNVTSSTVTLSWAASSDNTGVSGYRVFRNGQQVGNTASTSFTDGGLSPSTSYTYTVSAYDAAGNVSSPSSGLLVTTQAASDGVAPSVPSGLQAQDVTATQVRITWAASSDNVGVTGYRVYRDGVSIGTTTATNYLSSGLTANHTYAFSVAAFDAAGNNSAQSTPLSVTTSAQAGVSYTTNFDLTENPISEGGRWHRANNKWTNVRTTGGVAFGTNGVTNEYDDSYALLSGFGPDQTAEAVVYRNQNLSPGSTHEVELLLRFTDDAGNARGYECLFNYEGRFDIVRWNGPMGNFTSLSLIETGYLGRQLVTGDVIKATIVGNEITTYVNGMLLARAKDSTFTSGQPGIGFFIRPDGSSQLLGLTSYKVSSP